MSLLTHINQEQRSNMATIETKLKNGILIRDSRSIGCGVQIENQNAKHMILSYSYSSGFVLNMSGFYLTEKNIPKYLEELEEMIRCVKEANNLFK